MKKRKVFILGGGGFIGFAIVKILAQRMCYDITIGDNFHLNQDDIDFNKYVKKYNIKVIKKDFTNKSAFNSLENYDDFYMLASMIGVNNTLENPHEVIRINTIDL